MYNPASLAAGWYQSGLFGGTTAPTVTYQPDPLVLPDINFTVPVIKIAGDNSVPKPSGGPAPGNNQAWWDSFKDSVQNGAVWFGNGVSEFFTGDPVVETADPPATPADTNTTALLLAGAAVFILWKSSRG